MNKNAAAPTPPMGWNSWDCYGAAVNEEQLRGNAQYMAKNLKAFGWQYVVCDIQWYEPTAHSSQYHNFVPLEMDEYSRLIPAVNRFPSAKNGAGFGPIADYIHSLGLKFGIHIMRGIPRQAVHQNTAIKGTAVRAGEIAEQFSLCKWNTDMYGVNPNAKGAQEYYHSIFELYAQWGVDFVKVDDICNTNFLPQNPYSAQGEIECIRRAIDSCGRTMVLSLSPGPAVIEKAWHLSKNANMWRITDDFWDYWPALLAMFERCEVWQNHVGRGCWPDCDMLPLGHIGISSEGGSRFTNFTKDEQITMMSLWSIFRSPLMMGGELRDNDDWTLSLLTNEEVLRLTRCSHGANQLKRTKDFVVWSSKDEDGSTNLALFNISEEAVKINVSLNELELEGAYAVRDLWRSIDCDSVKETVSAAVNPHGAVLYRLSRI